MNAIVETLGLKKAYSSVEAVRGIDLRVSAHSVCAFLGQNGAGKSTTLRMLMGMTVSAAIAGCRRLSWLTVAQSSGVHISKLSWPAMNAPRKRDPLQSHGLVLSASASSAPRTLSSFTTYAATRKSHATSDRSQRATSLQGRQRGPSVAFTIICRPSCLRSMTPSSTQRLGNRRATRLWQGWGTRAFARTGRSLTIQLF